MKTISLNRILCLAGLLALTFSVPLMLTGCGPKAEQGGQKVGPDISDPSRGVSATLTLAEQEVIEALLSQEYDIKDLKKHVITDTTSVSMLHSGTYDAFSNSLRAEAKSRDRAFREALDDFLQKNQTAIRIVFPTNAPKSVELISNAIVEEIFRHNPGATPKDWDYFHQQFPGSSLITISRVGIDSQGTVAIIYLGHAEQPLSGRGSIRVVRREGKKWVLSVESFGPGWMS